MCLQSQGQRGTGSVLPLMRCQRHTPGRGREAFPSSSELLGQGSLSGLGCASSPGKDATVLLLLRQNIDFNLVENAAVKETR